MTNIDFETISKTKETFNGIDFYTLPISTNVVVRLRDGQCFAMLKPYKQKKRRERAIAWALEQFANNTLKPIEQTSLFKVM